MGKCTSKESSDNDTIVKPRNRIIHNPIDDKLINIDENFVPNVIFKDCRIRARVIDVYDGDTITVIFLIENTPVQFKIRLSGIDTPEIKSGKKKLNSEKIAAIKCRDYLNSLIGNKIINLTILDWDKYGGRLIGIISLNDNTIINNVMINHGYARLYEGKKKKKWNRTELKKIINL